MIRKGRFGEFVACSNYPECKYVKADENKINEETGETCPQCGSPMIYKMGRFGHFEACSNYPKCKYIKPQKLEEVKHVLTVAVQLYGKRVVLVHLKPALIIQSVKQLLKKRKRKKNNELPMQFIFFVGGKYD